MAAEGEGLAVAEDGDGWGAVVRTCGASSASACAACAAVARTCGASSAFVLRACIARALAACTGGASSAPVFAAFQLGNAFIDLLKEGLPVGFGAVGAGGAAVPVVLVELGAGPAVLAADVGDVEGGVGFGLVEAVAGGVHAAGDFDADEAAVGVACGAVAGVPGVARKGDAFDGLGFVDDDVKAGGCCAGDHGGGFLSGAGGAGGVVHDDAGRGHGVGRFEGVLAGGEPVVGEGVGHGSGLLSGMCGLCVAGGVADVLDEALERANVHAEVVEVFNDGGQLHHEVADVEHGQGHQPGVGGNEGAHRDAADEHEDAGELAQDAVNAALAGEAHRRVAPGGQAADKKVDDHGDADEGEDVEHLAFEGGDALVEPGKDAHAEVFLGNEGGWGHEGPPFTKCDAKQGRSPLVGDRPCACSDGWVVVLAAGVGVVEEHRVGGFDVLGRANAGVGSAFGRGKGTGIDHRLHGGADGVFGEILLHVVEGHGGGATAAGGKFKNQFLFGHRGPPFSSSCVFIVSLHCGRLLADQLAFVDAHNAGAAHIEQPGQGTEPGVESVVVGRGGQIGEGAAGLSQLSFGGFHLVNEFRLGFLIGFNNRHGCHLLVCGFIVLIVYHAKK